MSKRDCIPGPSGMPIFGNFFEFRKDMLGFLTRCARDYGDVSTFKLFHIPFYLINNPQLIERILIHETDKIKKPWYIRDRRNALGSNLNTLDGESWYNQRTLIQPAFHIKQVDNYSEIMVSKTNNMLNRWRSGMIIDLHKEMSYLTLNIISEALFGIDISKYEDEFIETIELYMVRFESMITGFIPIPVNFPTPNNLRVKRMIKRLHKIVNQLINEATSKNDIKFNLLNILINSKNKYGNNLSKNEIKDIVISLMIVGHITTATALTWTIILIDKHAWVYNKLLNELDEVLLGRDLKSSDAVNLEYTKHVLSESMRLYPPAWGISRESIKEIEFDNFSINPGSQILIIQYITHRDSRYFINPECFLPERWDLNKAKLHPKYAYLPFGIGPRICIGMQFAMMELTLVLALVMQKFRIEVLHQIIEPFPSLVLKPRSRIMVSVHDR